MSSKLYRSRLPGGFNDDGTLFYELTTDLSVSSIYRLADLFWQDFNTYLYVNFRGGIFTTMHFEDFLSSHFSRELIPPKDIFLNQSLLHS